jgi:hypothetical protein
MSETATNPSPDHHRQPATQRPGTAGLTDTTADNRDAGRNEATSTPASRAHRPDRDCGGTTEMTRRDGQGGTGRPADRRRRRNGHTDSGPRSITQSDRQQGNPAADICRPSAHRHHLHSSSRRRCVRCQRAAVTQVKAASFEKRDISRIKATRSRTPVLQNSQQGEVKATASRWTVDQRASSRPFSIFKMSASASPLRLASSPGVQPSSIRRSRIRPPGALILAMVVRSDIRRRYA